ncbi:hypothetical protein LCGC14_0503740 [marine sediment metagenome]|uniref:Uncharacterized protein n=1 Tax=marine sediment metagenome TaxID=412755 RepID=A0A0F9UQ22_9ZZZZ
MKIDQIKAAYGHVIVKVDDPMVTNINHGKLILKFDPTYDMYRNVKIAAEVVSPAAKLPKTPFFTINPGFPKPMLPIQSYGNYPTSFTYTYVKTDMQPNQVEAGDLAYFHYLTLHENNYLGKDEKGMEYYKCSYDNIFCVFKGHLTKTRAVKEWKHYCYDKNPTMTNGYILVEPYWGTGFVEVEIDEIGHNLKPTGEKRSIKVNMSPSGIIYDVYNKPIYGHGTIRHIGCKINDMDYGIAEGDQVIYLHGSEFKNKIEGKEYYIMKQWDVVAKTDHHKLIPVGDYVLMRSDRMEQSIVWTKKKKIPVTGKILAIGNRVNYLQPGDNVYYNHSSTWTVALSGYQGVVVRANQIWGKKCT